METETQKCKHCSEEFDAPENCECPKCGLYEDGDSAWVVNWFYVANYGTEEVKAKSAKEAIKQIWAGQTNKIRYVVSQKMDTFQFGGEE